MTELSATKSKPAPAVNEPINIKARKMLKAGTISQSQHDKMIAAHDAQMKKAIGGPVSVDRIAGDDYDKTIPANAKKKDENQDY